VDVVHTGLAKSPVGSAAVVWQLLRAVRAFEPDVVHCFKPIGYSGALAYLLTAAARRHGAPLVVLDADDLEGPAGWGSRRRLGIGGALRGAQEVATLRRAPLVTVASDWLREYLHSLGRPAETVLHLPNGHAVDSYKSRLPLVGEGDQQSFPPLRGGVRRGGIKGAEGSVVPAREEAVVSTAPTLLWYTRFTEASADRVVGLLIRILGAIPAARLVVIGEEIDPGGRAEFAAALADAGLDDRVDWRGYAADAVEDVLAGRSGPVVAIYPMDDDATNRARCPSKVPQLMALGVPTVAERVGEIPRYLAEFEETCLAPPGDADTFAVEVVRLLENAQLRAEVSDGLRRAASRWRWDEVAGGVLEWYQANLPSWLVPAQRGAGGHPS
jgi:glycosyltransferase involved in cell wall biosynthesis